MPLRWLRTPRVLRRALRRRDWLFEDRLTLADITLATAFGFTQDYLADIVDKERYRAIATFSARAEELPEFRAAPARDGAIVAPFAD
jgi:glutathione S-transferase